MAEVVLALASHSLLARLDPAVQQKITSVVPNLEKARLYRGKGTVAGDGWRCTGMTAAGGEIVRQAACRLIECISLSQMELRHCPVCVDVPTVSTCLYQQLNMMMLGR